MIEVKEIDKWPDNDKWAKARKDWDAMPKDEKEAYRREHAAAIDRWEAETDAMAEDDDTEEKKRVSKKYLAPSIYSYPYWRLKSNIRFYKGVFCLFGHPPYFSRISILWPSIPQGIGWYPTKEINGNRAVSRIMRVYLVWIVV